MTGKLPEVGLEPIGIHAIGGHERLHHGIGKSLSQRHVGPTTIAVSLPDRAAGISISHCSRAELAPPIKFIVQSGAYQIHRGPEAEVAL